MAIFNMKMMHFWIDKVDVELDSKFRVNDVLKVVNRVLKNFEKVACMTFLKKKLFLLLLFPIIVYTPAHASTYQK